MRKIDNTDIQLINTIGKKKEILDDVYETFMLGPDNLQNGSVPFDLYLIKQLDLLNQIKGMETSIFNG